MKMKLFSSFILSLCSVMGFSQTILYQAESTTRTVQDPQTVVLAQGFTATGSVSNPFVAKIGPATENPGGGPADSNAGANNPSGTTETTTNKFHDTRGSIEVTGAGQLQFTLPIALPPGVKNVAPQVNLVYTNNSTNGIVGYGWNISGVSSIIRVGKNIEKDGDPKGVQLDYSDYYSFNGQRLILKSGEYGKDGAEYVTEKYSNLKIKSIGTLNQIYVGYKGPEIFEVTFEDGSVAIYGTISYGSTQSMYNATTPMEYNIKSWRDVKGNYINYNYVQSNNVSVISSIQWGGNQTLGKSHFNEIVFNYITRDLKEQSYVNGISFIQDKLLSNIVVNANGSLFKKYAISYIKNGTNYQFVDKITESNSQNQDANAVTFTNVSDPTVSNIFQQDNRFDEIYGDNVVSGDFNGDGKPDFLKGNTLMLGRLDGTGQFINVSYTGDIFAAGSYKNNNILSNKQQLFSKELNYQNKSLIIRAYELQNNALVNVGTKTFSLAAYPNIFYNFYGQVLGGIVQMELTIKTREGDFDGDGMSDFIVYFVNVEKDISPMTDWYEEHVYEQRQFYVNLEKNLIKEVTGSDFYSTSTYYPYNDNKPYIKITDNCYMGNFTGLAKTDILTISNNNFSVYELDTQQNFVKLFYTTRESLDGKVYLGDFNGDNKTDILAPIANDSPDWRMYISTGNSFKKEYYSNLYMYQPSWQGPPRKNRNIARTYSTPDLNKDGKSDFIIFESQVWFRDGVLDWNNPDSSYGFNYLRNEGSDANGKPIFSTVYSIAPKEATGLGNPDSEDINYSMYGEHYIPLFGSFRISKLNTDFAIIHKTKLITWNLGSKLNKISSIKSIKQGGITTDVEYSTLANDGSIYKSYFDINPITYPYVNIAENINYNVVSRLTQGQRKQEFRYRDLIGHLLGKGMIGFRQVARSSFFANGFENTKIWTGNEITPANEGLPYKDWTIRTNDESKVFPGDISLGNTQLLSFKQYDYKIDKLLNGTVVTTIADADKPKIVTAVNPSVTISKDFLKNIKTVHTVETYNSIYLPTKSVENINDGFAISTSELEYYPSDTTPGSNYNIGKPKIKTDVIQAYGDTKSLKEEYTYENNLLKTLKTWNRDNSGYLLETYSYDGFGNVVQKVGSNSVDSKTETVKTEYDDKGRFAVKKTDNLQLETSLTYNDWGQVLTETDPLGNIITNTYDGWGKLLTSKKNLGGTTTYTYDLVYGSAVPPAPAPVIGTKSIEYLPDGNQNTTYTNLLGQIYKTSTKAFGQGQFISKEIQYDILGRKIGESEPYFDGQSVSQWNSVLYDDSVFPAKATITSSNGKQTEVTVSGNTTTEKEVNGYGRITSKTTDALGNISSSTDKGGTIIFSYNAAGEQIQAKYAENIVTTKYDVWGRKSEFNDPSNGIYKYEYETQGQLKKIISPKGTKEFTYNNLGQLITQNEISSDGGQATNKVISYAYDNKGRIIARSGTSKGNAYSSNAVYDPQGRLVSSSETSNGRYFIQKGMTYDDNGRIIAYEKQLFSSGVMTKVNIQNVYSPWNGALYQVKDQLSGKVLWQLNEANAKGQILAANLGSTSITNAYDNNGFLTNVNHSSTTSPNILKLTYSFDAIRNELKFRKTEGDFLIDEYFDYDDNNRLINWTDPVTGVKPSSSRNVYDVKGRIMQNDQVGTMKYENSSKIYQPTGMTLNPAGEQNYTNDLIQTIIYNENNDPVFIDGMKGDVAFQYGLTSMRQRITYGGNFAANGDGAYTKFYNEDGSYEVLVNNTTGAEKHIIYIGGTPYESNIIFMKNYAETTGSYKFLHKDYLGSILAITDDTGYKLEQRHFDAWGNMTHYKKGFKAVVTDRNQINTLIANGNLQLERGYTSHEYFPEVGIIHMNGRLYDPLLRRFLNADENIQDPYNTQNYNKYGYVLNNPLLYNDYTGEVIGIDDVIIAVGVAMFVSVATDYYLNRPVNLDSMFQSVSMSLMSMAVSAGIGEVFKTGGEVAKSLGKWTIVARAGAHAIAQGTLSFMQGGKFWSGALSGAFASASNDLLGLALENTSSDNILKSDGFALLNGAVSGGIGSVLGGGNFWAGAGRGLIVTAFNFLAHKIDNGPKPKKKGSQFKIPRLGFRLQAPSPHGTLMSIITGQSRHIWGPDAVSISIYGQVSSGINVTGSYGYIMTMNGKPAYSKMYGGEIGGGTVNVGGGIVYTEYYCACSESKISTGLFMGKGWSVNAQLDDFAKFGFGASWSNDNNWKYNTYMLSVSFGFDLIPTGVDININKNMSSQDFRQLKGILDAQR